MAGLVGILKYNAFNERHAISKDLHKLLFAVQNRGQASTKAITQMKNRYAAFPSHKETPIERRTFENNDGYHYHYLEFQGDGMVRSINSKIRSDLWGEAGIGGVSNNKIEESNSLPYRFRDIVFAKDGYINNIDEIKNYLINEEEDVDQKSKDSKVLAKLFYHHYYENDFNGLDAMLKCVNGSNGAPKIKGKYSSIVLTPEGLIATGNGKPLVKVEINNFVYVSSESTGIWSNIIELNTNNYNKYIIDIKPGVIMTFNRDKNNQQATFKTNNKLCGFETAYFARPESIIYGKEVSVTRKIIGELNAPRIIDNITSKGFSLENCVAIPVLSSGDWYAIGFNHKTNIPYLPGLFKDRHSLKSFILDYQENREKEVQLKTIPSPTLFKGKDGILFEDSIVRGTTMKIIANLLRVKSGINKVHVFAAWPRKGPCPYSSESRNTLFSTQTQDNEDMRKKIGVETLLFGKHEYWEKTISDLCFTCAYM